MATWSFPHFGTDFPLWFAVKVESKMEWGIQSHFVLTDCDDGVIFFFFLTPLNLISGLLLLIWSCNAVLFLTKSDNFIIKLYNIISKHFIEVTLFPRKKNLVIFRLRKIRSPKILSISDSDDSGIKSTLVFTAVLYVHVVFEEILLLAQLCKNM